MAKGSGPNGTLTGFLFLGGSHDGDWIETKGQGSITLPKGTPTLTNERLMEREVYELVRLAPHVEVYILRGMMVGTALARLIMAYVPLAGQQGGPAS